MWQFLIVSKRRRGTAGDEKGGWGCLNLALCLLLIPRVVFIFKRMCGARRYFCFAKVLDLCMRVC